MMGAVGNDLRFGREAAGAARWVQPATRRPKRSKGRVIFEKKSLYHAPTMANSVGRDSLQAQAGFNLQVEAGFQFQMDRCAQR